MDLNDGVMAMKMSMTLMNGPAIPVRNLALWTRVMGHDSCNKILINVVFRDAVAKRRRCSMLCVPLVVVVCVITVYIFEYKQKDVHVGVTLFAL